MVRVEEQTKLLLRVYLAERANDPSSRATESSRSNVIALRHTLTQMYRESEVWLILAALTLAQRRV